MTVLSLQIHFNHLISMTRVQRIKFCKTPFEGPCHTQNLDSRYQIYIQRKSPLCLSVLRMVCRALFSIIFLSSLLLGSLARKPDWKRGKPNSKIQQNSDSSTHIIVYLQLSGTMQSSGSTLPKMSLIKCLETRKHFNKI